MVNRTISLVAVLFFCGFISFIAINGTNEIYGKKEVQNISYKLPDSWAANISDKQFRLLELSLIEGGDFSVVLFANIQGTAAGKWSARKAQLLAKRYKAAGGGYR